MPELVELHETWSPRRVRVVAACLDSEERTPEELDAFLLEHEIRLPVLALAGPWEALADHYGFLAPPCTVLLGPGGEILERFAGRIDPAEVARRIAAHR